MKTIHLLFALCFCMSSFAQIEFGPRIGVATVFNDIETTTDNITSGDAELGFSFGMFGRFGTKGVKVVPEFLYTTTKSKVIANEGQSNQESIETKLTKIDVPINVQFVVASPFHLQGGLVGSYIVDADTKVLVSAGDAIENYKDFTLGYQAGLGVSFGKFILDLKYESSLSDFTDGNELLGFGYDERQSMVQAALGISLF